MDKLKYAIVIVIGLLTLLFVFAAAFMVYAYACYHLGWPFSPVTFMCIVFLVLVSSVAVGVINAHRGY